MLLTPRLNGPRAWDMPMMRTEGDNQLTPEELRDYARLWNR
ncbi:hypothetical protein [Streptomyces sp. NPDC060333]